MQLSVEEPDMASKYSNQSLAEQNSLDLAWELLMEGKFRYMQDGAGTSFNSRSH